MLDDPGNMTPEPGSRPADGLARWARRATSESLVPDRKIPAWLLSFVFHSGLFAFLLFAFNSWNRGGAEIENRTGGIVLVNADSTQTEYLSEGETELTSADSPAAQSPPPLASDQELPPELPGLDTANSSLTGVGDDILRSLPGAEGMLDGPLSNARVGGKMTTEVFGVKGTGSRFLYVFDRSASMEGYEARPLIAAKQQLLASLNSLGDTHQFQIIFYNQETKVFDPDPGPPQMLFATEAIKKRATRFVQLMRGDGGTDHMNALKFALSLGPDVIFLLTDAEGGFTSSELSTIGRWNRSGAVVNAIEFGIGSRPGSDRSLEQLARENGGQYTYKNIRTLRLD